LFPSYIFFITHPPTPAPYTLSLHDALPIYFASVEREEIKSAVKKREIRLVVATDAACEGLNLQTLGTLINVDLHWNPSRRLSGRSEEHTSELQSRGQLVFRLLLGKKKNLCF